MPRITVQRGFKEYRVEFTDEGEPAKVYLWSPVRRRLWPRLVPYGRRGLKRPSKDPPGPTARAVIEIAREKVEERRRAAEEQRRLMLLRLGREDR